MAVFEYTAINAQNAIFRGQLRSFTKRGANDQLRRQDLTAVTIQRVRSFGSWLNVLRRGVSTMDKIVFTRSLLTMIKAGMTISEALASTREQASNPVIQRTIAAIELRIQSGHTFAACLESYPKIFSPEYVAMIKVGERSGKLVEVLQFLTDKLEKDYRLLRKIGNALVYPVLIVVFMIIMITLMMLFVIPRVASIYTDAHVALPIYTRVLISISHFVTAYIIYIVVAVVLLGIGYTVGMSRWLAMRRAMHRLFLRLPMIGLVVKKVNQAVISRSLSMLLHAGMTIDEALILTAGTARNSSYRLALEAAEPFVARGVRLADIFRGSSELFLPVFQRMIATGEQTGNLDVMFGNVAQYYSDDIDHWSTNFSSIIEPVLISVVGVGVAGIAIAILFPLWNFVNVIN